jgi:hypothetical protein
VPGCALPLSGRRLALLAALPFTAPFTALVTLWR